MTFVAPQAKLFGHLDRLHELRHTGSTRAPINVEVDLSNRCSLGCEWCHFAYTHTRGPLAGKRSKPDGAVPGGDLMDYELARNLARDLSLAGVESITWTGGGEPTLHPQFDLIVGHTENQRIKQGIYTHGGQIDDARAALLKRAMTFVYVSLDAADVDGYKAAKGVDRFDRVCENVRKLRAAQGDATIGIGYLVTAANWVNAGRAAELAADLGADYIQFRPTIHYDQASPDEPAENTAWLDEALPYLEVVAKQAADIFGDFVEVDIDRFRGYQQWAGHGYQTCWWAALQTVITPNGKVWTCVNKREHPAAELGDLTVDSFPDIWARRQPATVDGSCRVMCRGHLANQALDEIMAERPHPEFV